MRTLKKWFTKLLCKWRGHPKVITFRAVDFAYVESSEWIKCECGERVSFEKLITKEFYE